MSEHIVTADTLREALAKLADRMPGDTDGVVITGKRTEGTWRVQGSIPIQRQPDNIGCCQWMRGDGHAPSCPDYRTHLDADGRRYWMRRTS